MATTIVNPATSTNTSRGNGVGFLIGTIALVIFAFLFLVYGLPLIQGVVDNGGTQVNVPKSIDVNVNQPK